LTFGSEVPEMVIIGQDDDEPLTIYVKKQDGSVYDLGDCSVEFSMAKSGASSRKAGGACTVTDASNGVCTYAWAAGETDSPGTYYGQIKITTAGSKYIRSRKVTIIIEEKVPES